jgi:predicted metal-binding protein
MQDVKAKWQSSGLVLVCERCFKERIPEEAPEIAEKIGDFHLRDWLKAELKQHGEWGPIRVISTSCLDICAKGRVTVAIDPQTNDDATEIVVVDAIDDRDALYDRIVAKLGKRAREGNQ